MPVVPSSGIVTLSEAKAQLNVPSANTVDDAELQGFINAAVRMVENKVGPVLQASATATFRRVRQDRLVLPLWPLLSVESVTVTGYDGTAALVDPAAYDLDAVEGVLYRIDGQCFVGRKADVAYTVGRPGVPANVRNATLELVDFLWQQSQQGGFHPGYGDTEPAAVPSSFAMPNRVMEMLEPDLLPPAVF